MTVFNDQLFDDIAQHIDHDLHVAAYGSPDDIHNIVIECRDCHCIALDIEPERNTQY